jgi:hypothetical protein
MKIGIIGSGKIGATVARVFVAAGDEVALANSRGPDSLGGLAEELGGHATEIEDAARFGGMVLIAVPYDASRRLAPEPFAGQIVIDAGNYYPARDGQIDVIDANETTSTELLADHLRAARMVKAFNTMYYKTLGERGDPTKPVEERLALFAAGDDAEAKASVLGLIGRIGFAPVDTGSLADGGRLQQPGGAMYNKPITGAQARALLAR